MSSEGPAHQVNSLILCKHTDNLYYEAKIMKVFKNKAGDWVYRLHYTGWNNRYDENIKHSDTFSRFMTYTDENIEMTKQQKDNTIALLKTKKKTRPSEINQNDQIILPENNEKSVQIEKKPIPQRVLLMIQHGRNVTELEEKTSVDEFLKQYIENGSFKEAFPNHPYAEEFVSTLLKQVTLDFDMNLPVYLTQAEIRQCHSIVNTKRKAQCESELSIDDMKNLYENASSRSELFEKPGVSFSDTYGVLHFARFLKANYNRCDAEESEFQKFYAALFYDLLCFSERYTNEYTDFDIVTP